MTEDRPFVIHPFMTGALMFQLLHRGHDEATARAMITDVEEHGTDSVHADEVGGIVREITGPLAEAAQDAGVTVGEAGLTLTRAFAGAFSPEDDA
jgi:hypothetical protein